MPIDASIYQAFAPRQRGALEYAQDFAGLDAAKQAQEAGALNQRFGQAKFDEYQRGVQDQSALRQLMGSMAGKDDAAVLAGLRGAGRFNEAGAMEKDMLDRQKKAADVLHVGAQTGKDTALGIKAINDAQADALKRYRGALDFVDTPQGAQRWLQALWRSPAAGPVFRSAGPVRLP